MSKNCLLFWTYFAWNQLVWKRIRSNFAVVYQTKHRHPRTSVIRLFAGKWQVQTHNHQKLASFCTKPSLVLSVKAFQGFYYIWPHQSKDVFSVACWCIIWNPRKLLENLHISCWFLLTYLSWPLLRAICGLPNDHRPCQKVTWEAIKKATTRHYKPSQNIPELCL